jgi:hypothetical protein
MLLRRTDEQRGAHVQVAAFGIAAFASQSESGVDEGWLQCSSAVVAGPVSLLPRSRRRSRSSRPRDVWFLPAAYNPETAAGYTNTFTPPTAPLDPQCPQGLAGTPGSDPANKVLNQALNTPQSFSVGGTVHYIYSDNPHGAANRFQIQDCEVVYPPQFFQASDFDPQTGVLINTSFTKADLSQNGTMIDGATLSGISDPEGNIYFSWTVQPVPVGSWICNFARDIATDHGGTGNRKVTPTCFQVASQQPVANIYLGYADSYRSPGASSEPINPSPWQGSPGVIFVGCNMNSPTTCPTASDGTPLYDAGAIRIDNVSSSTITVTGASVTEGGCTLDPWGSLDESVPSGETLILTQTGGTPPCGNTAVVGDYNFDTSEYPVQTCSQDNVIPQVSLTINGTTTTYADTNQVLNTGGSDRGDGSCPNYANETEDWTFLASLG